MIIFLIAVAVLVLLIAAIMFSKTKIHIDDVADAQNKFAVRIFVLGIKVLTLEAEPVFEGFINPRLDIRFFKRTFHLCIFERKGGEPVKSLRIEKLKVLLRIGMDDAAALALTVGFVNVIGRMYAVVSGNEKWEIGATPEFGKEGFRITGSCIISVRIADIIIALLGNKIKKARKT